MRAEPENWDAIALRNPVESSLRKAPCGAHRALFLDEEVEIAKVKGPKAAIVTLGKSEFSGEMAVIDGSSRSANAIAAHDDTRMVQINHARFVYLVSPQPAVARMTIEALSRRLRASNERTDRTAASS